MDRVLANEIRTVRPRWGVVLAGGDGKRLLSLTRKLTGDERPKQFCVLRGKSTLLEQTLERVRRIVSQDETYLVLTREHEPYFREQLKSFSSSQLLVQPANRGTTAAILYSLMRIQLLQPSAVVAFFPSDHYISNARPFQSQMRLAFELAEHHPDVVILLGITAAVPEVSYGWIEPGAPFACDSSEFFFVTRFWEKPSLLQATELFERRCLWNSFIMVGSVTAFVDMVRHATPDLHLLFESIRTWLRSPFEAEVLAWLYGQLAMSSFSSDVLAANTPTLVVMRSAGFKWSDLGEPARVLKLYERKGIKSVEDFCLMQKLTV